MKISNLKKINEKGFILPIVGASGSGKTTFVLSYANKNVREVLKKGVGDGSGSATTINTIYNFTNYNELNENDIFVDIELKNQFVSDDFRTETLIIEYLKNNDLHEIKKEKIDRELIENIIQRIANKAVNGNNVDILVKLFTKYSNCGEIQTYICELGTISREVSDLKELIKKENRTEDREKVKDIFIDKINSQEHLKKILNEAVKKIRELIDKDIDEFINKVTNNANDYEIDGIKNKNENIINLSFIVNVDNVENIDIIRYDDINNSYIISKKIMARMNKESEENIKNTSFGDNKDRSDYFKVANDDDNKGIFNIRLMDTVGCHHSLDSSDKNLNENLEIKIRAAKTINAEDIIIVHSLDKNVLSTDNFNNICDYIGNTDKNRLHIILTHFDTLYKNSDENIKDLDEMLNFFNVEVDKIKNKINEVNKQKNGKNKKTIEIYTVGMSKFPLKLDGYSYSNTAMDLITKFKNKKNKIDNDKIEKLKNNITIDDNQNITNIDVIKNNLRNLIGHKYHSFSVIAVRNKFRIPMMHISNVTAYGYDNIKTLFVKEITEIIKNNKNIIKNNNINDELTKKVCNYLEEELGNEVMRIISNETDNDFYNSKGYLLTDKLNNQLWCILQNYFQTADSFKTLYHYKNLNDIMEKAKIKVIDKYINKYCITNLEE